jgi:hypothetical protein
MDVKRTVGGGRRRVQRCHRHGHQCVTSQSGVVCSAIKLDQNLIDLCLAARVAAKKRMGNFRAGALRRSRDASVTCFYH